MQPGAFPMPHNRHKPLYVVALFLGALTLGCERDSITVTEVPKGVEKIGAGEVGAAETPTPTTASPDRIWTLPEGWIEVPPTSAMRLATVRIPGGEAPAELAITAFPGDVGGELANVNRWRAQMGLPPADASGIDALVERFTHPGYAGYFLRIDGMGQTMLAGGVYGSREDKTWFVRLTTDAAGADALRQPVLEFLKSFGREQMP